MPSLEHWARRCIFRSIDKVGPFPETVTGDQNLPDDLSGCQVPDQGLGSGVAECACQRAADLAGNTQGATIFLRNVDSLYFMAAAQIVSGQSQQPLPCTVAGDLLGDDFQPGNIKL